MTDRAASPQTKSMDLRPPEKPARAEGAPPEVPSFQAIFRSEVSYVGHSLRRLGVRERDLEDLTHDVFLVVHRQIATYDPARPLRPWLFGIAIRVALGYRRRAAFGREIIQDGIEVVDERPAADEQLDVHQRQALVLRALDAIDPDRRPVFVMHDIDGFPMPEIARALSIPLNTGYSRLRLARQEFAKGVAQESRHVGRGSP